MIELSRLRACVPEARLLGLHTGPGANGPVITGLAYDSRRVRPGDLFFCVRGLRADGHRFLPDAVERGAVAAVVETEALPVSVPALLVPDVRAAMPRIAAAFYGFPSRRLSLVGVTGTNGKTTTTYLIAAIARRAGKGTGIIGTIGARILDEELPGDRTTPEAPDLQALLARMADADPGAGMVVAMEVSSHALAQRRTLGCEFDVGVFTNLTQDHLDFHRDMEDYFEAKALLFTAYPDDSSKPFVAVLNRDDPYGRRLIERARGRVLTYGIEGPAEFRAEAIAASARRLAYRVVAPEGSYPVRLRIGGWFNVYNSLAAIAAGRALGFSWEGILDALESAPGVPGRFESVDAGQDFGVVVDYAHTPDGLENVLRAARMLQPRRLIVVFGCGGDRDRTKRPVMGRLAAEQADHVIVTSDNPRSEDPEAIIREILAGIPDNAPAVIETEPERRRAIERAVTIAQAGDLVVIAGKGHETYQIFADRTIHFDDREEARKALYARLSS